MECPEPTCATQLGALKEAAKALRWNIVTVPVPFTPIEAVQQAFEHAYSLHPDAVITTGISDSEFLPQLAQFKAANIPVVNQAVTDSTGNGEYVTFGGDAYGRSGYGEAMWIIAQSNGTANVLNVTAPDLDIDSKAMNVQFQATMKKYCPACSVSTLSVSSANVGTTIPQDVTDYLRAHPDIGYVRFGFSELTYGVPPALQAAGIQVKSVSSGMDATIAGYIADGLIDGSFNGDPVGAMFTAMDWLARHFVGDSTQPSEVADVFQLWLVTKDNLPNRDGIFPNVVSAPAQFERLWKVAA
jgi:ribose transport system substrate-binding protein